MITDSPARPASLPTAVSEVDVIVIGAGHNGLVAANYVADTGEQVLVVEANDQVGGLTSSGRTIPEAPDHLIHHFSLDPFLSPDPFFSLDPELDAVSLVEDLLVGVFDFVPSWRLSVR